MRDGLLGRVLYGTLPLIIWAAHFFAVYILVAAQCSPAAMAAGPPRRWMLGALSLLAIGACAVVLWRARRKLRGAGDDTALLDWAAAGSAVLAMAAIAWTSIPMLLIDGCG
jgi:hypothetical protein